MTPLDIIGLGLALLRGFAANGKTPDQAFTKEEMAAAAAQTQTSLDDFQAAINAARGNPPGN